MAVLDAHTNGSISPVVRLALLVDRIEEPRSACQDATAIEFLASVQTVANQEQAIALRGARQLAWARSKDLQEVGYSGWTAFVKEFSPWGVSHTRALVRLVESQPYGPAGKPAGFRERAAPGSDSGRSASLLGAWIEPTNLMDCVVKLRSTCALLQRRRMVLGMAYDRIQSLALWRSVPGCQSLEELCGVHLRIGLRTMQRYAQLGRPFIDSPALRAGVEEGRLTVGQALFAGERTRATEQSLTWWLELVGRLGRVELGRARERGADFREDYGPALDLAREVEAVTKESTTPAPAIGGTARRIAGHLSAMGATGPLAIALRDDKKWRSRAREREARAKAGRFTGQTVRPESILVLPELLAAAKYVVAVVELPRVFGVRRIVECDLYMCQNPRCRRRTLRVHPHHLHEKQHGGTDDPWNIVTLCPACHLRGIHSHQMSVVRIEDWLVWTWPDGGAVLMHSPVSDLVYGRRAR